MATLELIHGEKTIETFNLAGDETLFLFTDKSQKSLKIVCRKEKPKDYYAALAEFSGRWILFPRWGTEKIRLNRAVIVGMKVLRHGDRLELCGQTLSFVEETIEILTASSPILKMKRKCPVDQELFKEGDKVICCPRCQLPHHQDCWYLGGCASNPWDGYRARKPTGEEAKAMPGATAN